MAATNIIPCRGLQTDPSAVVPPPGGLRRAENVIIDAPGVASARPNFDARTSKSIGGEGADRVPHSLHAYDGDTLVIARGINSDDGEWYLETEGGTQNSSTVAPPDVTLSPTQYAEARRNAYLTTDSGLQKVAGAGSFAEIAGMHAMPQGVLAMGGSGNWLANNSSVAYRWVLRKVDGNGLETVSAPSPWSAIINATGSGDSPLLVVVLPDYAAAGDVLEVYRTLATASGTPSDTMFLAVRHTLESSDITASRVELDDVTAEAALGEALYTNTGREGIEGANERPWRAVSLGSHSESLWVGSLRGPHELLLEVTSVGVMLGHATGDITSGSPVITNVAEVGFEPYPEVDHIIKSALFPAGTTIVSTDFIAGTITLSANATGSATTSAFTWHGYVDIDGERFVAEDETDVTAGEFACAWDAIDSLRPMVVAEGLAACVSFDPDTDVIGRAFPALDSTTYYAQSTRLLLQRTDLASTTSFSVAVTSVVETEFTPLQPFSALTSAQESKPNRIAFSKPQEPEHWRALDWIELGREDAHVLGFASLAGGLLVLKEDGVWSLYGTWPVFSAEMVSDAVLARGAAVDVFEDVAYAWTDRGLLAMTERGAAQNLTDGRIRDEFLSWTTDAIAGDFASGGASMWVACWDALALVLVGAGNIDDAKVYVLHTLTGEWSTWDLDMVGGTYTDRESRMLYARAGETWWELRESVPARGYDVEHSVSAWDEDGSAVVSVSNANALAARWVPRAGDFIRAETTLGAQTWFRVLSVLSSPTKWTLTLDIAAASGVDQSIVAREGSKGVLEWQRHGMTPPSNGGFVREQQLHLDTSERGTTTHAAMYVAAGGATDMGSTRSTLVATPTYQAAAYSRPLRFGTPRAIARATHLYPYAEILEMYRWRCLGLALVGEVQSTRVRR